MALLANDTLGSQREHLETPLPASYFDAFEVIDNDPHNMLIVAEQHGRVVGVLQLTFIPGMTYRGGWRAQIEGVRVAGDVRGHGVGKALIVNAIEKARDAGCHLVQLTTDRRRSDAIRFYESIGFRPMHDGMKLWLSDVQAP